IALVFILFWFIANRKIAVGTAIGLYLIYNMKLWKPSIETLALVLAAAALALLLGIPLGILTARSNLIHKIIMPLLDFMQTMPAFVYLIPAVLFFGLGQVPGLFATVVFAMPPTIRLTGLGIRQVPVELVEATDAFGSTEWQKLIKVQIPLALPTIMAGVNQCIMLSLSMVVIAAMIGAGGLGNEVLAGISRLDIAKGFEGGLAIVIMAIILDRVTQSFSEKHKVKA
ncbi:MAG: ABC transporter permease subunit, partial [Bacillota bacterium]|nr:ABC transporter permease subunit [Bacillota bacterium]